MLKAIDAFSGAGGLSLGLESAGFQVVLAFDNDPVSVRTYNANLSPVARVMDASTLSGEAIKRAAALHGQPLDLLAGGPPCQGFSLQRRGERDDARNNLVLRYLDWLSDLLPRAFLLENVQAITSVRGKRLIAAIVAHAESLGYMCDLKVLDASHYGLPQRRRRAFLVGIRHATSEFPWPEPMQPARPATVRDAIADLPSPPNDGSPHPTVPNHYREARLSPLNLERIRHVPEGGGRLDLPDDLQLACHQGTHRHLDVYGRLAWNAPSGTITARFDSFTRGRFGHPVEDRSITIREGARLQGFPDDFVFVGNREEGARQVGNAVPPPLAAQLGMAIRRSLRASSHESTPRSASGSRGSADRTA